MNSDQLAFGFLEYVVFLLSTTCHEASHSLVAKWGGDTTALEGGQVSLNPLPHIKREPFGMVVMPLLGIVLGPLIVWLARRDQSAFVAAHAKEALNFNISVLLAAVVCALLMLVFIGVLLGTALFIAWLVLTLIAAIKASEGELYRYPFSLRLVK